MTVTPFLAADGSHRPSDRAPVHDVAAALWDAMVVLGAKSAIDRAELLAPLGQRPGLEALSTFAAQHRMVARLEQGKRRAQFPYVALLRDGGAVCVVGHDKARGVACQTAGALEYLSAAEFAKISSGQRLLVTRAEQPDGRSDRAAAWSNIIRLARLVASSHKARLVQLLVAALLSNILLVVVPLFTTLVYDRVVPYGAFETLVSLCIGILIVFAVDAGLRMTRVNLQEAIGVTIGLDLQAEFYRKLVRAPLSSTTAPASGIPVLLQDIENSANIVPTLTTSLLADLPFVVVMLILVAHLGGAVAAVPLIGVLAVAIIAVAGSARGRRSSTQSHRLRVKVQDQALESAAMLATLKMARAESSLIDRWMDATDAAAYAAHTARQASAWSAQLSVVATQLIIAGTVAVGALQINAGAMTLGNLAACVLLVGRIIAPASTVASGLGQLLNMRQSISGYFAVVDRPAEVGGDETSHSNRALSGSIEVSRVSLKYPSATVTSLRDVSLSIRAGERVAIVGRNGSGKSTLLKLLPRLYEPENGVVLFDGIDSRQIPPSSLRKSIGLMGQDTVLVNDTLRANVCLGACEVTEAQFELAVEQSGLADFARRHPEGYNALVGTRGEALSGGIRQAVGLARIILQQPRIVLLDEPTAAMDNAAEARLMRSLPVFLEGRTLILATHRTQLLNLVDRIIWMEGGQIVADGPKAQVLASLSKAA